MNAPQFKSRDVMKELILREIKRLAHAADMTAFIRYADTSLKGGALDFVLNDPELPYPQDELPINFNYVGLGIWFMCRRYGETFHMRHIIVEIGADGVFLNGQAGEQEGYWEDFPAYLSDEVLLGNIIHGKAA